VRASGWQGHICVKNLPRVGGEVCAKFGQAVHMRKRDIGTNSLIDS